MGLFQVILFLISTVIVSCEEYVPVMIWSPPDSPNSFPAVPALSRLTSNEFYDYLLKRVKKEKPLILLFSEENLSVEDFRWRDVDLEGNVLGTAINQGVLKPAAFLPSVHDPIRALQKLKNHGYSWRQYKKDNLKSHAEDKSSILEVKFQEPDYLEDRPGMLMEHDEKIVKTMKDTLKHTQNVIGIYTGHHASWIDAELSRFKREEAEMNDSDTLVISDSKNTVMMALTPPIVYVDKTGEVPFVANISGIVGYPSINTFKGGIILTVKFPLKESNNVPVNFNFSSEQNEWWTLNGAALQFSDQKKANLLPTVDVGAPSGHSFFCNPIVTFTNGNISLTFDNFQVQPNVGMGNSFGPVLHCIPFFSIAIWSGLVIVFILFAVLAWGILMIMDINTNDRFDDPKGKTITIIFAE